MFLYSPDDALIVRNINTEILLLFILWNVTKYLLCKCIDVDNSEGWKMVDDNGRTLGNIISYYLQ